MHQGGQPSDGPVFKFGLGPPGSLADSEAANLTDHASDPMIRYYGDPRTVTGPGPGPGFARDSGGRGPPAVTVDGVSPRLGPAEAGRSSDSEAG